jgi:hypothetical protein
MAGMLRPAPNRSPSANLTCWSCLPYNPEMVYCIDTKHCTMVPSTVDMYIQSTATKLRTSPSTSRRPISLLHSPQARRSKTGLVRTPEALGQVCRVFATHLTALVYIVEAAAASQQPNPFQIFPPSRRSLQSDPISLGGNLRPLLAPLVTRSNPACLGDYTGWHVCSPIS